MSSSTSSSRRPARSTSPKAGRTSAASSGRSATAPTTSLRDQIVAAAVATSEKRSTNWRERLPDDVRAVLEDIRQGWKDGAFQSSCQALARSMRQRLLDEGYETVGVGEIRKWLAES